MTMRNGGVARVVLARTRAGQREVLEQFSTLDEVERRLLLLVNGFTPLHTWAERFGPDDAFEQAAARLLERGLVVREVVVPDPCLDS